MEKKNKQAKQSQQTGFQGLFSISLCSDSMRWFPPSNKLWYNKHAYLFYTIYQILAEVTFCVFFFSILDFFFSVVPAVLLPNLYKNLESHSFGYNPTEHGDETTCWTAELCSQLSRHVTLRAGTRTSNKCTDSHLNDTFYPALIKHFYFLFVAFDFRATATSNQSKMATCACYEMASGPRMWKLKVTQVVLIAGF